MLRISIFNEFEWNYPNHKNNKLPYLGEKIESVNRDHYCEWHGGGKRPSVSLVRQENDRSQKLLLPIIWKKEKYTKWLPKKIAKANSFSYSLQLKMNHPNGIIKFTQNLLCLFFDYKRCGLPTLDLIKKR